MMNVNKVMKKIILLIILLICLSCHKTAVIDSKIPFIVTSITSRDGGMSEYSGTYGTDGILSPSIILPTRMYNIGDTISFKKHLILK